MDTNFIPLYLYILFLVFLVKYSNIFIISAAIVILTQLPNMLSVSYLDGGDIFMFELGQYSYDTSASYILLFLHCVFLSIGALFFNARQSQLVFAIQNSGCGFHAKTMAVILLVITGLMVILIGNVVVSGSPLWTAGINKVNFWSISKFPFLAGISSQLPIFLLIGGIFLVNKTGLSIANFKLKIYFIYILTIVYLVLLGHKFGQLIVMTYIFYLPLLLKRSVDINRGEEYFVISKKSIGLGVVFLLIVIYLVFNFFQSKYGDLAGEMIFGRILISEGQLSYVAIETVLNGRYPSLEISIFNDIVSLISLNNDGPVGLKAFQYMLTSAEYGERFEDTGTNLSQGYLAYIIFGLENPFLILLTHILYSSILVYSTYLIAVNVIKLNVIEAVVAVKIFFALWTFYAQGYLDSLFNLKTLFWIALLVALSLKRIKRPSASIVSAM